MDRIKTDVRYNWKEKVEEIGFKYHSLDNPYWDESAYYKFSMEQINELEKATNEIFEMCLKAVQHVIDNNLFDKFFIPKEFIPLIIKSWNDDDCSIYGRFDLAYNGIGSPKLLEFNGDTPTSLFEASIIQWFWSESSKVGNDQFNSIHERLVDHFKVIKPYLNLGKMYFACLKENIEDFTNTAYIQDCAIQAEIDCEFIHVEDIGWDSDNKIFVDLNGNKISNIFKLYPWEWLVHEEFGNNILVDSNKEFPMVWIEPIYKMILSNKAILPILWEMFPNSPYLLPSYWSPEKLNGKYVEKPLLSREGSNITIKDSNGDIIESVDGEYGDEGFIYQEFYQLPKFDDNYTIIGSWVIAGESAGIGMRESKSLITDNVSRFVPHIIE